MNTRRLTLLPSTRDEVEAQHRRRLAAAEKVDGLGYWVGLVDDEFVGWWILQPAHEPVRWRASTRGKWSTN